MLMPMQVAAPQCRNAARAAVLRKTGVMVRENWVMLRFRVRVRVRFKTKHSVTVFIMLMPFANACTGGRNVEMFPG